MRLWLIPLLLLPVFPAAAQDENDTSQPAVTDELDPIHESITIVAEPLGPSVQPDLSEVFRETLFSRDDQIMQVLGAGINAGQHEGGGKSLEIRRFGFNTDHGGVNGGLRITVDNVSQNYGTQGHGQGYVGALKSLSPELVEDVRLINGPFSAEHGDYSGLGVVQIRTRESLPDEWTVRLQGGQFDTYRGFISYSPDLTDREFFIAYDGSHTDGPFIKPLDYVRHNVTGNYTWLFDDESHFGVKWNGGFNDFNSSGQLPIDQINSGQLDRFGSLSPGDGGEVQQGRVAFYYRKDWSDGSGLRADAFIERSLFDLYSNFTFFLGDPEFGDAIQQHDSRLGQGGDLRYAKPHVFQGGAGEFVAGGSFLANQNLIDLRQVVNRNPINLFTAANANVFNGAGYAQEQLTLLDGRLQLTGGMRWDFFRFATDDFLEPEFSRNEFGAKLQPKAAIGFAPWSDLGLKVFYNYGRGISSLDARGVVRRPESPAINTTDFNQWGLQQQIGTRFTIMADYFWIRQSNQIVYIPDDGTIELAGPSQSYGFETRSTLELNSKVSLNGGITKVFNAHFRDTNPREYVTNAPFFVTDAAVTVSRWRKFSGSLRMRAINSYRLDGFDPTIRAEGNTVFDFAMSRPILPNLDFNFAVDNIFNRDFYETQNFFESRLAGRSAIERIHATPNFGRTVVVGVRFHFREK